MVLPLKIPSAYQPGYGAARAVNPTLASSYIAHTTVGDPEVDAVARQFSLLGRQETARLIQAGMEQDYGALVDAPPALRDFFERLESPPDWVDHSVFIPGVHLFHRNTRLAIAAFVAGTLVEGFTTGISKSFFVTGRMRDQGVRRLNQNNRHLIEIFMPGGLARHGDGWKLSVRIRLVHAQIRCLLEDSDEWDAEAWGAPISAAHMGFAICAFSARLLKHMQSLGAVFNDRERESFMAVWRYTGLLIGVPETILFRDEKDALEIFEIGRMCEPIADMESISMANALVNSAPTVIGADTPASRRKLAKQVYRISRALIGDDVADQLKFPLLRTLGLLPLLRASARYSRLMDRIWPSRARLGSFARFTFLLSASTYDEAGIDYRMPDHVHAEESREW